MELIKAVLMGIVEGITEWLPISSTGHMLILEPIINFNLSLEFMSMFRVVIQLGAIMAVVVLYWNKLWPFTLKKGSHYIRPHILMLWAKILVACIPAAILGLLMDDWLDEHLYNHGTVAAMLILYGILFFLADRGRQPVIQKMSQLTYRDALWIGLWQVLALIPGTSRSGATIVGALLLGISRPLAAQFTFYLAVPVMFGASALKLFKYILKGFALGWTECAVLAAGMVSAFLVSLVAIRFLVSYVKRHSFQLFGWYRIILGVLILAIGMIKLPGT